MKKKINRKKEYTKMRVNMHRTLTPKPYNSIKVGLELERLYSELPEEEIEEKINLLYAIMKKSLNEMEHYEMDRVRKGVKK